MKTDIIRLCAFDRKPEKLDLYINEDGDLYKCYNPEFNEKEGWPGKKIKVVIPVLQNTHLSIYEMVELSSFVWKNKIKDGTVIEVHHKFKL